MKLNKLPSLAERIGIAVIAFLNGCVFSFVLLLIAQSLGVFPSGEEGEGVLHFLLGLGIWFGFVIFGGLVAAVCSWFVHTTVTIRFSQFIIGIVLLSSGVLWIIGSTSMFTRYVVGPASVLLAIYTLWTAMFGSRSDVEDF